MEIKKTVLIDGREIEKQRGFGHFLRELLFNIDSRCENDDYVFFVIVPSEKSLNDYRARYRRINFLSAYMLDPISWEQITLPYLCLVRKVDFLICPYNTYPLLMLSKTKLVIVIHDLIFLHSRRFSSSRKLSFGNRYRSILNKFLPRKARLLTVSAYTQDLLLRFRKRSSSLIGNNINHLLPFFHLRRVALETSPYFLHVGGDAGTKNTRATIEAYRYAQRRSITDFPKLVVLGLSRSYADSLKRSLNLDETVKFAYNVSDQDKCSYYSGCRALVFPSLREGFGLPLIEAHAAGKRVITSRRRPLSDLASSRDVLIDPTSVIELGNAMLALNEHQDGINCAEIEGRANVDQYEVLRGVLS